MRNFSSSKFCPGATRIRHFAGDERGNIAIMLGFMVLVLFGFAGAAVDYSRFNAVKSNMIESLDAAGLAIAQLSADDENLSTDDLKAYGRKFFHENFRYDALIQNMDVDFTITAAKIIPEVTGTMKTSLLSVGFFDEFNMTSSTEITRLGTGQIELALVLDATGSMNDPDGDSTRIESLRTAVDSLLTVIFADDAVADHAKIAVIPFNGFVNPGESSGWASGWGDLNGEAYYHGAHFIHVDEDGEVNMDTAVNHYNLFDSVPETDWKGCVEARPYPLDELDVPANGSTSASALTDALDVPSDINSPSNQYEWLMHDAFNDAPDMSADASEIYKSKHLKFVPVFVPDGPDCDANWRGRCPYFYSNSYWTASETFTVNGSSYTQNLWRSWFVDPSYDGRTESDYFNRNFVDDETFIGRYSGEPLGRYAKIVEDFQSLGNTNYSSLSDQHQKWYDFMVSLGVKDGTGNDQDFYNYYISSSSDSSHARSAEYILRMAYPGWWDPATETYKYRYDLGASIDETTSDSDSSMRGPNRNCPTEILPLTNVKSDIQTHMDKIFPNGNTNAANGAIWGWRAVSPGAPFTEGAEYSDTDWQKAVVIMTDGNNNVSDRDTHWETDFTAYGYAIEERMGVGVDTEGEIEDEIDNKMLRICHRMKEQGILVYTIVFGLDNQETENIFKACATKTTAPYYYKAPSGEDLDAAFGDIAQDLVSLHVSK
ncbi:MAG: TadE/TadG family type IV pilus assembly protein [Pseudomonadota bacterium]